MVARIRRDLSLQRALSIDPLDGTSSRLASVHHIFHLQQPTAIMAALPQLLPTLFPAAVAVLTLLLASAPGARAHASSSSSATYRCGWCPRRSTASLLPPDAGALTGAACGYGGPAAAAETAIDERFHIAAVSAGFFSKGRACSACYQLRCRGRSACAKDGVKVVVVGEVADTNKTAAGRFLLTKDGFAAMTTPDHAAGHADAAVDVDFRRIPCVYKSKNLAVKVEETSSRGRGYLALRFLYQGGQTDIAAVEVAKAVNDTASGTGNEAAPLPTSWQYMTRREESASVWRTSRVPAGPLRLRLVVTAGSGGKWLRADGAVLPAEWQPGAVYDTGLRVTDVAANTCGGASCSAMDEVDDAEQLR